MESGFFPFFFWFFYFYFILFKTSFSLLFLGQVMVGFSLHWRNQEAHKEDFISH